MHCWADLVHGESWTAERQVAYAFPAQLLQGGCTSVSSQRPYINMQVSEVAFTGDTTIAFVKDPANAPALHARLLIMECTFLDDAVDQEGAQARGHMHVRDLAEHADCFQVRGCCLLSSLFLLCPSRSVDPF